MDPQATLRRLRFRALLRVHASTSDFVDYHNTRDRTARCSRGGMAASVKRRIDAIHAHGTENLIGATY